MKERRKGWGEGGIDGRMGGGGGLEGGKLRRRDADKDEGGRCGRVEDSATVWHSGCPAAGAATAQGSGRLQPRAVLALSRETLVAVLGPRRLGRIPVPQCTPPGTRHPSAWPRQVREQGTGKGSIPPPTATSLQLWGPSPKAIIEQNWCVPTARAWGQIQ